MESEPPAMMTITDVKTSGEFSEMFWVPLLERLKTLRWSETSKEEGN